MSEILFLKDKQIVHRVPLDELTYDLDCRGRVALAGGIDFDWVLIGHPQSMREKHPENWYTAHKRVWDNVWYSMDKDFNVTDEMPIPKTSIL